MRFREPVLAIVASVMLAGWVSAAGAGERMALSDAQMDGITAGSSNVSVSTTAFAVQDGGGLSAGASFSVIAMAVGSNGSIVSVQAVGFASVTQTTAVAAVEVFSVAAVSGAAFCPVTI